MRALDHFIAEVSVSDDPKRWEKRSADYKRKNMSIVDVKRAVRIGKHGNYRLIFAPLYRPDRDEDFQMKGEVLAITPEDDVAATVTVSHILDMGGVRDKIHTAFEADPAHRRKGLVTAMLKAAERYFGTKVVTSDELGVGHTADAAAFWRAWKARR